MLGVPIAAGILYFVGVLLSPMIGECRNDVQLRVGHRECAARCAVSSIYKIF